MTKGEFEAEIDRLRRRWGDSYWNPERRAVGFQHFKEVCASRFSVLIDTFLDNDSPIQPLIPELKKQLVFVPIQTPELLGGTLPTIADDVADVAQDRPTPDRQGSGDTQRNTMPTDAAIPDQSTDGIPESCTAVKISGDILDIVKKCVMFRESGKSEDDINAYLDSAFGIPTPRCARCRDNGWLRTRYRDPRFSAYQKLFRYQCDAGAQIRSRLQTWDLSCERFYELLD